MVAVSPMLARPPQWRLATRLTLLVLALLLPLFAIVWATGWRSLDERRDQRLQSAEDSAATAAALVDGFTRDLEGTVTAMALGLGRLDTPLQQEVLEPYLQSIMQRYSVLRALFVTDAGGTVIASPNSAGLGVSVADRPYLLAAQQGQDAVWSGTLPALESGQPIIAVARPIRGRQGDTVRGYLIAALYPERLSERFPPGYPEGAGITLVDSAGTVIFASQEGGDALGQNLLAVPAVRSALQGDVAAVSRDDPLGEVGRGGVFVPVPRVGWAVGFTYEDAQVEALLMQRFWAQAIAITGVIALAALTAVFTARKLTEPLSQLAATARAIAAGEQPQLPNDVTDVEVAQLSEAIRKMNMAITERFNQLRNLYVLSDSVSRSESLAEIYQLGLDAIEAGVGVQRSAVLLLDDHGIMRFEAWHGLSDAYRTAVDGHSPWGPGTVNAAPVLVPDVLRDASLAHLQGVIEQEGIRSLAFVPLTNQGQLLGKFMIYSDEPREFSETDMGIALSVASHIGFAVGRERGRQRRIESEERLRLALQASQMGVWEWDVDSGVVTWSSDLEKLHGIELGSFGGRLDDVVALVHPEDRDLFLRTVQGALAERRDYELEYRSVPVAGMPRWFIARGQMLLPTDDLGVRMIGVCGDITNRKRSEMDAQFLADVSHALAEEFEFRSAIDRLARTVVPYLADWCVVDLAEGDRIERAAVYHADPAKVAQARGMGRCPMGGQPAEHGVAEVLRSGQGELLTDVTAETVVATGRSAAFADMVMSFGVRSAMCLPLEARGRTMGAITFIAAESGRRYDQQAFEVAQEVTRRASLSLDNARLFAQVQAANVAKDEFLGVVSHELRTPVTSIYGATRLLHTRGARLDQETKDGLIVDVEQEAERLSQLVDDLLLLARLELGQTVTPEPVMVQRVVEKVCATFLRTRHSRQLVVDVADGLPPAAGEESFVSQVLRNLLSNADKYSPREAPIEVVGSVVDGEVVVRVLDRGSGLSPEDAERVFDPFYRAQPTAKKARGLGIGLTACKRLVDAQSGRIWVQPRPGGGLEVGFALLGYTFQERQP